MGQYYNYLIQYTFFVVMEVYFLVLHIELMTFTTHSSRGRRDRVVVWFKTTYEIGVYHH
jgi:hypothetical protein